MNDAKVDRWGRIWAGSKDDRGPPGSPGGALYRFDADRRWTQVEDQIPIANGPTFSPDGSILYHVSSSERTVHAYDLTADGTLRASGCSPASLKTTAPPTA